MSLNELHLFAGCGGGILGGVLLGHNTICAVENNKYAQAILLQRQRDGVLPKFPIWDDVRTFNGNEWRGSVDIICGGFPCQDFSIMGNRKGFKGDRSSLWFEMVRIISEVQPSIVFIENVPTVRRTGLFIILKNLAALGYNARWGVIGGFNCGLPHVRERLWIVANSKKYGLQNVFRLSKKRRYMDNMFTAFIKIDWNLQKFQRARDTWKGNEESMLPPYLCRVDDGYARNMDRIESIGNAQIPIVAAYAFYILNMVNTV